MDITVVAGTGDLYSFISQNRSSSTAKSCRYNDIQAATVTANNTAQVSSENDDTGSPTQAASKEHSAAWQDFWSHPLFGYDADGTPIVDETKQEQAEAVTALTQRAVARGQDESSLHFIKAKYQVTDGFLGPVLGYQLHTAVELTGMTPIQDSGEHENS